MQELSNLTEQVRNSLSAVNYLLMSYNPSVLRQLSFRQRFLLNMATCFGLLMLIDAFSPTGLPFLTNMAGEFDVGKVVTVAIVIIITFILALIASLIGVSLISPVATAVGGALKNGNLTGAANSVTAQITLIFVTLVIIGILVFLALFGFLAAAAAHDG